MSLLPVPFRALVIGSSGSIGGAFVELLEQHPSCSKVVGIHRNSIPSINYENFETIQTAANELIHHEPFHLIINTIGILHTSAWMPEKKLTDLHHIQLTKLMEINAIGPAITIQHFVKLLNPQMGLMVTLSAKVGSIKDNRLGGWYSYRASKAALNMLIKTAAIELKRTSPNTALIAMHPGTVRSNLSEPFRGQQLGRPAIDAAVDMFNVMSSLTLEDTGSFISYSGERLPW